VRPRRHAALLRGPSTSPLDVRHANPLTALSSVCLLFGIATMSPAAEPASDTPFAMTVRLYRDYAAEAIFVTPTTRTFFAEPPAVLEQYLDDSLVELILKDRNCHYAICNLDFLPMWDSMDPLGAQVEVKPSADPGVVLVKLTYPNGSTTVRYHFRSTSKGWRIYDVDTYKGSLVALLKRPIH
jgi:hypothetical protein